MKTIARILGEAKAKVRPPTEQELTGPENAYFYARGIIKGRWPEGEEAIAQVPYYRYRYAMDVIGGRWPEAEETIAKSEYKNKYLKAFPDAIDDWALLGWTDWMDVP